MTKFRIAPGVPALAAEPKIALDAAAAKGFSAAPVASFDQGALRLRIRRSRCHWWSLERVLDGK